MADKLYLKLNDVIPSDDPDKEARRILALIKPSWDVDANVDLKIFDEGITNKVIGYYEKSDSRPFNQRDIVMFRIFGQQTEKVVDREVEVSTLCMLHQVSLGPQLYCQFGNGLAYEFVKGEALDCKSCRDPKIMKLVAAHFAQWHALIPVGVQSLRDVVPTPIAKCQQWIPQLVDLEPVNLNSVSVIIDAAFLTKELEFLLNETRLDEDMVFSHNDTLLANIIYDSSTNTVRLIDYEYGGPSYRAFDLGNHFDEWCGIGDTIDFTLFPSASEQKQFIQHYLEAFNEFKSLPPPSKENVSTFYRNVGKMCLLSHFYWGVWALLQSKISQIDFDYLAYGKDKLTEYFTRKDEFLNL